MQSTELTLLKMKTFINTGSREFLYTHIPLPSSRECFFYLFIFNILLWKRNGRAALPLFIKCFQIKVFVEHSRFLFFIKSLLYIWKFYKCKYESLFDFQISPTLKVYLILASPHWTRPPGTCTWSTFMVVSQSH